MRLFPYSVLLIPLVIILPATGGLSETGAIDAANAKGILSPNTAATDPNRSAARRSAAAPPERAPASGALAKGVFLIASESLSDPNFSQTVVLLLDYDQTGAIGLIINRPTEVTLASLLPELEELSGRSAPVFIGGPVGRTRLFLLVRSTTPPPHSEEVVAGVYVSTSLDTLRDIIAGEPEGVAFQAYAGYAGWAPGQLDGEMLRGDWLVTPGDSDTVFEKAPSGVWRELIRRTRGLWVRGGGPASVVLANALEAPHRSVRGDLQIETNGLATYGTVLDEFR